ncbi:uncharacterized protein Z520_10830 [Fonsecaea multimorphosa CBS 102226]|uniref:HIT-type domain-containing protein n=1 Tax=Fonsecaea multimorphosa CBS 102226 TaxID=1442371 RepID=A0A0D2I8A9_9EURO|nr:uncharacterized protein Z520_10830 [Fonsecaea multimorphosa CBS 102226]KIX93411.1 hypothetical protein Z520_10830 [Fonsecaea multimorphosa CBS 102226]OAL18709.1 hypothetical protein AYO22_10402 [Fonsecaea multimorphosa]
MPLIEELPVTTTARASHGWTYVPDNVAPIPAVQLGSRKRGRDGAVVHAPAHKLSAKQEKAIQQRLNDLNKENYREANIPIPKREGARGKERKTTQNVRRILAYNRTFQHYLADEEAGVNVYGSAANVPPATSAKGQARQDQTQKSATDPRRRSAAANDTPSTTAQKGASQRRSSLKHAKSKPAKATGGESANNVDVEMPDAPPSMEPSDPASPTTPFKSPTTSRDKQQPTSSPSAGQPPPPAYDPALDRDPLLRTLDIPKMPSERVMQALLSEPPLSYVAARAKTLDDNSQGDGTFAMRTGNNSLMAKPQRWFCSVCGYWGKVRCKYGCGERVCGLLDCWKGHEAVCTLAATGY